MVNLYTKILKRLNVLINDVHCDVDYGTSPIVNIHLRANINESIPTQDGIIGEQLLDDYEV